MTKQGNNWLRHCLGQIANVIRWSKKDLKLKQYYKAREKKMGWKKALVSLARKVLNICVYLLKEAVDKCNFISMKPF
jgi:hypothetical protein